MNDIAPEPPASNDSSSSQRGAGLASGQQRRSGPKQSSFVGVTGESGCGPSHGTTHTQHALDVPPQDADSKTLASPLFQDFFSFGASGGVYPIRLMQEQRVRGLISRGSDTCVGDSNPWHSGKVRTVLRTSYLRVVLRVRSTGTDLPSRVLLPRHFVLVTAPLVSLSSSNAPNSHGPVSCCHHSHYA